MLKKEFVLIVRKSFIHFVILAGLGIFFSFCSDKTQQEHPNNLFIMVDDLRPELNCYGNKEVFSPNIDQLAENGVLFQHAYCQQAICMASRASISSGYYSNTNRIYSCLSMNELDTSVPLIIHAPGLKKNVKTTAFAEYVDLFPTLVDLCGFEIPSNLQGKSLVPVLKNPASSVKKQAFSVWPSYKASRTEPGEAILGYSVRTQKFRYTEWIRIDSRKLLDRELYDHEVDPMENKNVLDDEKYAAVPPELSSLIKDFREKVENSEVDNSFE